MALWNLTFAARHPELPSTISVNEPTPGANLCGMQHGLPDVAGWRAPHSGPTQAPPLSGVNCVIHSRRRKCYLGQELTIALLVSFPPDLLTERPFAGAHDHFEAARFLIG
jgi:hypothetical protein